MKVEILYNNECIAVLKRGQQTVIPTKEFKFAENITIKALREAPESNYVLLGNKVLLTKDILVFNAKE